LADIELNRDGQNVSGLGVNTITDSAKTFKRFKLNWLYRTMAIGDFKISIDYADKVFDEFDRLNKKYHIAFEWKYDLL